MTKANLTAHLQSLVADYRQLVHAVRSGKEKNHRQLPAARAEIARARTVLRDL